MAWQKAGNAAPKKDNAGALFKNKEKSKETDPDYKGPLTVSGRDYYMASWINKAKDGSTYMSVKLTPKDDTKKDTYRRQEAEETGRPFDDEIPF